MGTTNFWHRSRRRCANHGSKPRGKTRTTALSILIWMLPSVVANAQPPNHGVSQVVGPTIEIQKLEPEHPTEGQVQKIFFTLTNWLPNQTSGWVSANFAGVTNQNTDTQITVTNLASRGSISDAVSIMTPRPGDSTKIVVVYYDKEFILNRGFRKRLIAQAEMDVDILHSYVSKRISGSSFFTLSKPDPHDSYSDASGYLVVRHDPGCGWVGNDGTDKFFVNKPLPVGAKIDHIDYRQWWPTQRECDSAWSWLNDSGSYNARFDNATDSIRWHNACTGAYSGKGVYYTISFTVSMLTGTDLGEPLHEIAENAPMPPAGFSLTEQPKPDCSAKAPPPVKAPVLFIQGPYITPDLIHEKMPFAVSYTVGNSGTASLDSFDVTLYIDGVAEKDTKTVPKLAPNQTFVAQWNITKELTGFAHTLDLRTGSGSLSSTQLTLNP